MDPKAVEHIREILHDKNRIWGQLVHEGAQVSGLDAEQLAAIVVGGISLYLTVGEQARFFANSILFGIPLFIHFFAPQEKPRHELFLIYCGVYAVSTTLDPSLQDALPAYYVLKVLVHALIFLRPYCLAEQILAFSETLKAKEKEDAEGDHKLFSKEELKKLLDRKAKSPPPEKPEGEKQKTGQKSRASTVVSPWPVSSAFKTIEARSPPEAIRTAVTASAPHRVSDQPGGDVTPKRGGNTMVDSPSDYRLNSSASSTDISSDEGSQRDLDGRGVGAYDVEWQPKNKIVYNGPFDYAHLTYHIKMKNTSNFPIGFAIKSNAIPRVTASPSSGLIPAGKSILIGVTLQKIENYDEHWGLKDRIAFEYVRVPKDATKFEFKFLQMSPLRMRHNIHIKYNP